MILKQLIKDARQTYTYLEIKTGINHLTITKYLKKLEEDGIILGYSPDICVERLQNLFLLLFKVEGANEEVINEFNFNSQKIPEIIPNLVLIDFYSTLGEYQFVFVIGCDSIKDVELFIENVKKSFHGLGEYLLLNGLSTNIRGTHIKEIK